MKMAVIMFDDMTTLDFAGFLTAVTWLKRLGYRDDLSWQYCAIGPSAKDDRGMVIAADAVRPDLGAYDLVLVPGGMATRRLIHDRLFMEWIGTAGPTTYKTSVCTGALLLGAAGFLAGKRATTNPLAYELLEPYCLETVRRRVVRDGNVFTGGGITASVDLGIFFVATIAGEAVARDVQRHMDYPYYAGGDTSDLPGA
ncbi:MAG: DJ-1/PfpI family protein [Paenibacillaceae bacterium]|nr:DJ-1/PfpI family protein [Paenibacillaceae bacterium]